MLCFYCREQLPLLLSDALSSDERAAVEAHLAECAECARELRALQLMSETLASLPLSDAPISLRANVRVVLREPERKRFALPFLFPQLPRNLAWGGAVAVSALGLMLLARNEMQPRPDAMAPMSDSQVQLESQSQESSPPAAMRPAPAARVQKNATKPKATLKTKPVPTRPATVPVLPPMPALPGAPEPVIIEPTRPAPKAVAPKTVAPVTKPQPAPKMSGGASDKTRMSPGEKISPPTPNELRPAPKTPSAPAEKPKLIAPPASPDRTRQDASSGPAGPPGIMREAAPASWTGGEIKATLARRASQSASSFAGDAALARNGNRAARNSPSALAPVPAPATSAETNDAATDQNAPRENADRENATPKTDGAPLTLILRAEKSVGLARLILILPDQQIELWRGNLGATPLEIPLRNPTLQRLSLQSGQKLTARLEQINGAGESLQSTPLELSWP